MPCLLEQYSNAHTKANDAIPLHVFHEALRDVDERIFSRFRVNFRKRRRGAYKKGTTIPINKISNACNIARRALGYCPMCNKDMLERFNGYENHLQDIGVGKNQRESVYFLYPNETYQQQCATNPRTLENLTAIALPTYANVITKSHILLRRRDGAIFKIPLEFIHTSDIQFLLNCDQREKQKQTDPIMLRLTTNEHFKEHKVRVHRNSNVDRDFTQEEIDEL